MSTQPKKKQKDKVEPRGKDGKTRSERMREQDEKLVLERSKQRAKERMEKTNKEANEKAQKEKRDKAREERLKKDLNKKPSKKPREGKKLPGEGVEKTPAKMPDGFTMDRPAHKLGYIQKLGADRMSPGKMGDMTAMKMMHGDAAAKYYDGAGMYMNGAPKYEGASKSYVGPMTPGHGGAAGHTHIGDDRPSYTKQTTTTEVIPGKSSSTSTASSGGSTSGRTNFSSDPEERAKQKQWIKDNPEAYKKALADKKKKAAASSSSSSSTSTQPKVKETKKSETITSKVPGQSELNKSSKEVNVNMADRYRAGQKELVNLAKQDSINKAQSILEGKPVTKNLIQYATQQGNLAGYKTASRGTQGRGTFDTNKGEFRFSKEEAANLFNPNIGKAKATVTDGYTYEKHKSGSKNILNPDGLVNVRVKKGSTQTLSKDVKKKGMYTAEDVGKTETVRPRGTKSKGERKITSVDTETGSQGSFGGFNTAKEFLQNFKGGTPKMPKGPMKFGMRK